MYNLASVIGPLYENGGRPIVLRWFGLVANMIVGGRDGGEWVCEHKKNEAKFIAATHTRKHSASSRCCVRNALALTVSRRRPARFCATPRAQKAQRLETDCVCVCRTMPLMPCVRFFFHIYYLITIEMIYYYGRRKKRVGRSDDCITIVIS